MLFHIFFPIIKLFKNFFNRFINCIFTSIKNNWFPKIIINTYNVISKITWNMTLIFFSIWSIITSSITFKVSITLNGTANCLKSFSNLIEPLLDLIVCLPFYFQTSFFIFYQNIFTIKTISNKEYCKQYLQKCFLFLCFALLNINLLKFLT